jgi:hypothetical protein
MPGILLAGEVIKQRHFCDYRVRDYLLYNIFGEPLDIVETLNRRKDARFVPMEKPSIITGKSMVFDGIVVNLRS